MAERNVGRLGAVCWLFAVWLLLWGRITPVVVVGGLGTAVVLAWVVRLPQVRLRLRPRPLLLLAELGRLLADIARSSAALVRAVLTTGPATRSSLVRVPVSARDEGQAVLVASWISLEPGSLVVAIDLPGREVVVHVVPARPPEDVRREAIELEGRLLRAVGGEQS